MVAADFERGASMRVAGTTVFPQAMAFGAAGDPSLTRFEGEVTAREARALGVHWVYSPWPTSTITPRTLSSTSALLARIRRKWRRS